MPLPKGELALSSRRTSTLVTWIDEFGRVQRRRANSSLLTERIYLARQSREKTWKRQNEPTHPGYYWFSQLERHIWYETMSEYLGLMFLDQSRTVRAISAQPMLISFGNGHSHYPDYLVLGDRADQTMFNVHRADKVEEDPSQFEAAFELCQRVGWRFELFTGLGDAQRANLEWLSAYRHPDYRPSEEQDATIRHLAEAGPTFGELLDRFPTRESRTVLHVYNMIWCRELTFDFDRPLSEHSTVWAVR